MWDTDKVLAITCSDIHLSLKPPMFRSAETDWLGTMRGYLLQLCMLQETFDCPILFAGDLFHNWNAPAELIHFAMKYLPSEMYCIPGQHDMPYHNYDLLDKSAYAVLARSGTINDMPAGQVMQYDSDFAFVGYPYGYDIKNVRDFCLDDSTLVGFGHEYKWIDGYSYPNAPESKFVIGQGEEMQRQKWLGYDIFAYGDNHKGFETYLATTKIFNCGGFTRRNIDEYNYEPRVGIIYRDEGVIFCESQLLNTDTDKYINPTVSEKEEVERDMSAFIKELHELGDAALNFHEALHRFCAKHKTKPEVKKLILEAIENE